MTNTETSEISEAKTSFRLHLKIMSITVLVLLFIFVFIGLLSLESERIFLREQAREKAQLTLEALSAVARQAYFAEQFQELHDYLVVLHRNDRDLEEALVYDRADNLCFRTPRRRQGGCSKSIQLDRTFYVNRMRGGRVVVRYRLGRLDLALKHIGTMIITGLLASLLLVGLTIHLAVKHVISIPLGYFVPAAHRISDGDLDGRIHLDNRKDEIGELARAFNVMVDGLLASKSEIERINADLERRVTDRTRELRYEKARSEAIIQSLADALITIDKDFHITYWNRAAEFMTGLPAAEVLGKSCREVLKNSFCDGPCIFRRILDQDAAQVQEETSLLTADGTEVPVVIACAPLIDPDNDETIGGVLTLRDMTRINELHEQIRRSDRLSSLGVLAAGVAHELNNPIGNISTFAQLLSERSNQGKKLEPDFIDRIVREVQRASGIVKRLLEFSRQENPVFEHTSLKAVIKETEKLVSSIIRSRGMSLKLTLPDAPAYVVGDAGQLEQVFINLVTNAAQATRDSISDLSSGSSETESGEPAGEMDETIEISLFRRQGVPSCWVIDVLDRGHGIPDDIKSQIFNPFFTTKKVGQGTGLGLSVSHSIVKDHGGEILVSNRPGGGSRFRVILPAAGGE